MSLAGAVVFSVAVLAAWAWGLWFWGRHQYRRGVDAGMDKATTVTFALIKAVGGSELAARVAWLGIQETQEKINQKGRRN